MLKITVGDRGYNGGSVANDFVTAFGFAEQLKKSNGQKAFSTPPDNVTD